MGFVWLRDPSIRLYSDVSDHCRVRHLMRCGYPLPFLLGVVPGKALPAGDARHLPAYGVGQGLYALVRAATNCRSR